MKEKNIIYTIIIFTLLSITYLLFDLVKTHEIFPYYEISAKHAHAKNDDILIVDIRPQQRCDATGKAKNAYHLPIKETTSPKEYLADAREIAQGKTIAFICNEGRSSKMVAMQYRENMDAHDVTSVMGGMEGINGWISEKLPVEACSR